VETGQLQAAVQALELVVPQLEVPLLSFTLRKFVIQLGIRLGCGCRDRH
jgi:hypothetical protein